MPEEIIAEGKEKFYFAYNLLLETLSELSVARRSILNLATGSSQSDAADVARDQTRKINNQNEAILISDTVCMEWY